MLVCSGADVTITLPDSEDDVTYTLYQNGGATAITAAGSNGNPVSFTLPNTTFNNGDNLTVRAAHNITGCQSVMNGTATVQTNDPQVRTLTAVDTDVCTNEDAVVEIANSENLVTYEIITSTGSAVVATATGNGGLLTINVPFANLIDGDDLTARANNGSCTVSMNGTATVSISSITVAAAGSDDAVCADTYTLGANAASAVDGETGTWSVVSGSGTFDDGANDPTTGVSGLSVGDNTFRWTISNGGTCTPTTDEVTITRREITVADAGTAQTVCTDVATLGANATVAGESGQWTVTTGAGTFTNSNDPTTTVSSLGLGTNVFTWTISDGVCPATASTVSITRNNLTADAGTDQSVPNGSTATLSGAGADGTGTYSYEWQPAAFFADNTLPNPTTTALSSSQTFTLTVTDDGVGATCQATDQVSITVTGGLPSVIASADGSDTDITICEGETVSLTALGSGGDGTYTYSWTSDNTTVITNPGTNSAEASPTVSTTFTVEVTDGNGDTATDDIVVDVTPLPQPFAITNPIVVCSGANATLELSGSETGVSYQLVRGGTAVTALPPTAGTGVALSINIPQTEVSGGDVWTVEATRGGCIRTMTGSGTIQINDPSVYNITTAANLTVCRGEDVTIDLDGSDNGVDYQLILNNTTTVATRLGDGNPFTFTLTDGNFGDGDTYTVVANNGSCSVDMGGSVTISLTGPDATFAYDGNTFCVGSNNPRPQPGYVTGGVFSTTDPVSVNATDGTIDIGSSTVGGPYEIFYELTDGTCTNRQSFQISIINSTADATFTYPNNKFCIEAGVTVAPSFGAGASAGMFTFTTSGTGTLALSPDGTIDLENSTAGTYRVVNFIDGFGGSCPDASAEQIIEIFNQDVASISYASPVCPSDLTDPTPTNSGTTGGVYSAVGANAADIDIVPETGLIDLSDTDPGTYTIEYVTPGFCSQTTQATVEILTPTDASFGYPAPEFCKGSGSVAPNSITTPGGNFTANMPGLAIDANSGTIDVDNSDAGSYLVTYETAVPGACNGRETVAVTIGDAEAEAGPGGTSCNLKYQLEGNAPAASAAGEWTVDTKPLGAADPSFLNRFDPNTEVTVTDPGTYQFEWTITQGVCSNSDVVIIEFAVPLDYASGNSNATACGVNDGFAFINPDAPGSYTVVWSDGGTTGTVIGNGGESRDDLLGGEYTVTIIDNNTLCEVTLPISIGVDGFNDFNIAGNTVCTGELGEISITSAPGDTREYQVTYFDEDRNAVGNTLYNAGAGTGTVVTGLPPGNYNARIEVLSGPDAGCIFGDNTSINESAEIVLAVQSITRASCVGNSDGNIDVDVSGVAGATYEWYEVGDPTTILATTEDLTGVIAGDYSIDISHSGSCVQTFGPFTVAPTTIRPGPTATAPLASSVQCNSFEARWNDAGAGFSYLLDVSTDASFTTPLHLEDQAVGADITTFNVNTPALTAGTDYWYRVRSVDGTGCISSYSDAIQVTTLSTAVPEDVRSYSYLV